MIKVLQQPWVNRVTPDYLLDMETRVEPENVVTEMKKQGWVENAPIILVLHDNATIEWIREIVQPIVGAGNQNFEFIRWQQSIDPVEISELAGLFKATTAKPVTTDNEEEWGPMAEESGLQSRLTLQTEQPAVGQPLLFRLELRNSGDKPTKYDPQDYFPFRVLRGLKADGKPARFIGMTPQTEADSKILKAGDSVVLWENVDASELFLLDEGRHEFLVKGGKESTRSLCRDSNRVVADLKPGKLSPPQALIKSLLKMEMMPRGWDVSAGFGAIYITNSPTNLKQDVTTIQLWFTETPLPADYHLGDGDSRQNVTTIGRCEIGYLHLAALGKVVELWPVHVSDIRTAAARALNFDRTPASPDNPLPRKHN